MDKNVKIAKELVKLAKSLIAKKPYKIEKLEDLKEIGQYYDYGNGECVIRIKIDDDWLPVLANGRYESRPDIEDEARKWMKEVEYVELGDYEQEPDDFNEIEADIIVRDSSKLLKEDF